MVDLFFFFLSLVASFKSNWTHDFSFIAVPTTPIWPPLPLTPIWIGPYYHCFIMKEIAHKSLRFFGGWPETCVHVRAHSLMWPSPGVECTVLPSVNDLGEAKWLARSVFASGIDQKYCIYVTCNLHVQRLWLAVNTVYSLHSNLMCALM